VVNGDARACCLACIPVSVAVATADWLKYQLANGGPGLARALRVRHPAVTNSEIAILVWIRTGNSRDAATGKPVAPYTVTQKYSERKTVNAQL
jgi:hypothetical protein